MWFYFSVLQFMERRELQMATLLRENDSSNKHINASARHIRLCRQVGASTLVEAIEPKTQNLRAKQAATKTAIEAVEAAHDDILFTDGDQDNTVKNGFDECKRYDRDNPGSTALSRAFPDGRFTTITMVKTVDEPDEVDNLAARFESFGASHPLFAHAALLRQKAAAVRAKIDVYKAAIKAEKVAEADEQIAKFELRQQYEQNYLDARKLLGKPLAERLFPALGSDRGSAGDKDEPPTPEQK
jgi:hypothetical protein